MHSTIKKQDLRKKLHKKHKPHHSETNKEPEEMSEYKIPNSTVSKKITARTPLPNTLVKGSTFSKTADGMSGGRMLKSGEVSKINVPPCSPSPPAKK